MLGARLVPRNETAATLEAPANVLSLSRPRASTCRPNWHVNLRSARRGSAAPANGTRSAAAKS